MMSKVKLFCIPYAGGSASVYNYWKNKYESLEVCPLELAGRGSRYSETLYNNLDDAVEDICNIIVKEIQNEDFVLYGHSMGALFAYEVYNKLFENKDKLPVHLYISGRRAPHLNKTDELIHNLPYEKFKEKVIELGGTNEEFFDIPELVKLFVPILRNDFKVCETYQFKEKNYKIQCPITVFSGSKDNINIEEIKSWSKYTDNEFNFKIFDGGHFFINNYGNEILSIINSEVTLGVWNNAIQSGHKQQDCLID